jgi:dihydrodipicolinate synthase/N-acetylneuraminate lyase
MKVRGVVPVLSLPFNADETISEESFRTEVDFAIDCGATGVCAPGFGTEFYKLTDEERRAVIRMLVEQTARRVPVFAGTGCGSVRATIEMSRYAESVGADAVMIASPKWCALGPQEQTLFFKEICRGLNIPIMLQDADFTGSGLPPEIFGDLAESCPSFHLAKIETVLPGTKCAEIIRRSGGKLQVLYGVDGVGLLDGLGHGATGVMPGAGFIEPYVRIFQLYDAGRTNEARTLFYRILPCIVFAVQHLELAIQMDKRVLVKRGVFISGRVREPTLRLDQAYQNQMDELSDLVVALSLEIRSAKAGAV